MEAKTRSARETWARDVILLLWGVVVVTVLHRSEIESETRPAGRACVERRPMSFASARLLVLNGRLSV